LRIRGEQVLRVEPFPLPESDLYDLLALGDNPAIRLFLDRGRAVRPELVLCAENTATLAAIVRRLDGLPLALELAAARLRLLSPEAVLERLQDPWHVLQDGPRDAPARQQSLRDTIAWSYGLLSTSSQQMFRQLSVFVGGCTIEAAMFVCDLAAIDLLDQLHELADLNLIVTARHSGQPRFTMLETIHEFAEAILANSDDEADVRQRHAAYFGGLLDRAAVMMLPYLPDAAPPLDQLNAEYPNIRAAIQWLRAQAAGRRQIVA
jgi:predicted ATPase